MKTTPSGLQIAFLFVALAFGAMLVARWITAALGVPDEYFNLVGNLVAFPLEAAFIFGVPSLRELIFDGLRPSLTRPARTEALALSGVKVALTFGLSGATALWALHVTHRSSGLDGLVFLSDRAEMDRYVYSTLGALNLLYAISLGPFMEELMYRGVLFRLWERQWGWIAGMLLSATVFSVIHPHNQIQTFLAGVLYVCLFRRTGTLWAPILCHCTFNLAVQWPFLGQILKLRPLEAATSLGPWIPHLICLAIGLIGFVFYVGLAARTPARR